MTEIIGYIAAFLTTISFLPQAIKTIKTRDTAGISLLMYLTFSFGVAGWLTYGALSHNLTIVIANAITLALALTILTIKIQNITKR